MVKRWKVEIDISQDENMRLLNLLLNNYFEMTCYNAHNKDGIPTGYTHVYGISKKGKEYLKKYDGA